MTLSPPITLLKNKRSLMTAILVAVLLFFLNYRLMASLPAQGKYACLVGGALTSFNVGFAVTLSLLTGIMAAGIFEILRQKREESTLATGSLLGFGATVGIFTIFCTACVLPVFSFFGLSLGFGFFMTYNLAFKAASLLFLLFGLHSLGKQLDHSCRRCAVGERKR